MKKGKFIFFIVIVFGTLISVNWLNAHYTWISSAKMSVDIGEKVLLYLSEGHQFPDSEAPPNIKYLKTYSQSPSEKRIELFPVISGKNLVMEIKVREHGLYIVYFESDRGILSRTPRGWQQGGKDKFPTASGSRKLYSSCLTYILAGSQKNIQVKPLGLAFEIKAEKNGDQILLTVFKTSKPVEGIEVSVVKSMHDPIVLGKTNSNGEIWYDFPENFKGSILFIARHEQKMPLDANYQVAQASSTLFLHFE